MSECNHVFIGRSDGVHCTKCGLRLSAMQYAKLLHPDKEVPEPEASQEEKPKRQTRKKVIKDE